MKEIDGQFAGADSPDVLEMIDWAVRAGALWTLARETPEDRAVLEDEARIRHGMAATYADALMIDAGLLLMRLADDAAGEPGKAPAAIPGREGR